jgi:hypothetical protein
MTHEWRCPQCGYRLAVFQARCPRCGIVLTKALAQACQLCRYEEACSLEAGNPHERRTLL